MFFFFLFFFKYSSSQHLFLIMFMPCTRCNCCVYYISNIMEIRLLNLHVFQKSKKSSNISATDELMTSTEVTSRVLDCPICGKHFKTQNVCLNRLIYFSSNYFWNVEICFLLFYPIIYLFFDNFFFYHQI